MQSRRTVALFLAALTLGAGFLAVTAAQDADTKTKPPADENLSPVRAVLQSVLTPETIAQRLGAVVLILLLSYAAYRLIVGALAKAIKATEARSRELPEAAREREQRALTIMSLLSNIVRWVISILALIWVLGALGMNLLPVLTGVGFLGAAIAFGSQTLVRDIVSGFFLLLEGQYAVGDYVELSGKFGMVEAVGLRTTVLRDLDNQMHHIPNGSITACTVYEQHFVNYSLRVPIAKPEDAPRAAQLIQQMAETTKKQFPRYLLMVSPATADVADDGISVVSLPFAVLPTQDWMADTELPNRAKVILASHEIAMPEGMAPQSISDLSNMPLVPVSGAADHTETEEEDLITRWKRWAGVPSNQEPDDAPE